MNSKALLLAALISVTAAQQILLNKLADKMITSLQQVIRQQGKDEVAIPNIVQNWEQTWQFITVGGHFSCRDGKLGSLASIRRTGDATFMNGGKKLVLMLHFGLGTFKAKFGSCDASIDHVGSVASSKMDVSVDSNSIAVQISVTGSGDSCKANVDHAVFRELGKISIHTGGGLLNQIQDRILETVAKNLKTRIIHEANMVLTAAVKDALPKDLCKNLPF